MDFNNEYLYSIEILGREIAIYESVRNTWLLMIALIAFAIFCRIRLIKAQEIPSGIQNFLEACVELCHNFTKENAGEVNEGLGGYAFSLFIFVLCCNLMGLIGLRPPTTDLATTLVLALNTFFMIHLFGIIRKKGAYFKGYLEPMPLFLPLNIIGEVAKPISLSFRLFGNILGGLIIMGLVYGLFPNFLLVGVPAVLHGYFDVFAGVLQAFVITILTLVFIKEKTVD